MIGLREIRKKHTDMSKSILSLLLLSLLVACSSNDRGEVLGKKAKRKWFAEKPYGMVLVPGGSYTMGKQDEDPYGGISTLPKTVSLSGFYMDETEVTNSEYFEFVDWVKDSVVRTALAFAAQDQMEGTEEAEMVSDEGILRYLFREIDTASASAYEKYRIEYYGVVGDENSPTEGRLLDWKEPIIWDEEAYVDVAYAEVMDKMYLPYEESPGGERIFDVKKIKYAHSWFDKVQAAKRKKGVPISEFVYEEALNVYPDTLVWIKDFKYAYNDPIHENYFWHPAYQEYPVVGVNWKQARAFCHWKTKKKNDYLATKKNTIKVPDFRLPTEAEWEYAARGGQEFGTYPWGGPYTVNVKGCFMANFKPLRGDYAVDGALYTVEADSYFPNGYGLYNMAGNVSEWTNTSYYENDLQGPGINLTYDDSEEKRKIIRGGSWKDIAYFLQVSTRDYENRDSATSYLGFRTVQDHIKAKKINNNPLK